MHRGHCSIAARGTTDRGLEPSSIAGLSRGQQLHNLQAKLRPCSAHERLRTITQRRAAEAAIRTALPLRGRHDRAWH